LFLNLNNIIRSYVKHANATSVKSEHINLRKSVKNYTICQMFEFENNYFNDSILDLSNEAAAGIASDSKLENDAGFRDLDLIIEMEQADFNIHGALMDAYDELYYYEEDGDFMREFVTGAALSHKGIRYQASIQNEDIPLVDDMSSKGLLTAIKLCMRNQTSYIYDRAWHLEKANPQILDVSNEYLELKRDHYSARGGVAFVAGSIVCYELLYQNIASEAAIDNILYNRQNFN